MQKLRRVLTSCILIGSLAVGTMSRAQETSEAIPLKHDGEEGVWLPYWMSQDIQADSEELRLLRPKVNLYVEQLELRAERIKNLNLALHIAEQGESRAIEALDGAVEDKLQAEAEVKRWYRHPALWFTVGIVVTIGLEVAAVKLVGVAAE